MKHFNKALVAASLAALTTFTSCVDNEVAPEVQQLRAAQVAYVTASANLQAANAKWQEITNAHTEAMNAFTQDEQAARTERNKAQFAKETKRAQADLAIAEKDYQIALVNLEVEVALAESVAADGYLAEYTSEMASVYAKSGTKIELEAELAEARLMLNSANAPWEESKITLENDLARLNGRLEAEKASLALMEGAAEDPSAAIAELNAIEAEISRLKNENEKIELEADKKWYAANDIREAYYDAMDDIANYNSAVSQLQITIASIGTWTNTVSSFTATYNSANAELTALNTVLTQAKAALTAMKTAHATAKADYETKNNALLVAQGELKVAQDNYNANPTPENQAIVDAKQTAVNDAQTARDAALTVLNDAQSDLNAAQNTVNTAQNNVNNQQNVVNSALNSLNDAKRNLEQYQGEKVADEASVAALLPAHDEAVANKAKLWEDYRVADQESDLMWNAYNINWDKIDNLEDIIWNFTNYMASINEAIDDKKDDIANTMEDIRDVEESLAAGRIDKAEAEGAVKELEGELESLTNQIEGHIALAAKYKALLDAALAVN